MADPIDDQGPFIAEPPSRVRRVLTVAVLLALIVSMIFLAWVSGRGEIRMKPDDRPRPTAQPATATTASSRLAIVDAGGHLATTDAIGGSVVSFGGSDVTFAFPAWSPDGTRIATVGTTADDTGIYIFTALAEGAAAIDPLVIYRSADLPPFYLYWAPDGRSITFLVFVNVQSGAIRSQRPVQVSDTFTAQMLPYFDQYALSHRLWSSDGASFALPIAAEDGTSELVVIQADGSDVRRVADGVAGFWSP